MNIVPHRQRPTKRKIYLWKKSNSEKINEEEELRKYSDEFTKEFDRNCSVEAMWHSFKNICHNMIENHVPTRSSSTRFNQPWINRKVKSLSRKKQRQWNTARKSGKESDWARYEKLQKQQKKRMQESLQYLYK